LLLLQRKLQEKAIIIIRLVRAQPQRPEEKTQNPQYHESEYRKINQLIFSLLDPHFSDSLRKVVHIIFVLTCNTDVVLK
jgi:hypothetical protein